MALVNGDLLVSNYGDIQLLQSESDDIIQMANNSILMRYGENMQHRNLGNKAYYSRVKISDTGSNIIKENCIDAILRTDSRVDSVESMTITRIEGEPSYSIEYVLLTKSGNRIDGRAITNIW